MTIVETMEDFNRERRKTTLKNMISFLIVFVSEFAALVLILNNDFLREDVYIFLLGIFLGVSLLTQRDYNQGPKKNLEVKEDEDYFESMIYITKGYFIILIALCFIYTSSSIVLLTYVTQGLGFLCILIMLSMTNQQFKKATEI